MLVQVINNLPLNTCAYIYIHIMRKYQASQVVNKHDGYGNFLLL